MVFVIFLTFCAGCVSRQGLRLEIEFYEETEEITPRCEPQELEERRQDAPEELANGSARR